MKLNIAKLDNQIDCLMHLQDLAKAEFDKRLAACSIQQMFKDGYQGMVELKDGKVYLAKVKWGKNPNWKLQGVQ